MGTIRAVITTQMPKQVWQAEDGSLFSTEKECVTYERADKVMRLLYQENGEKREWDDLDRLENEMTRYYQECGFSHSDPIQTLLVLWEGTLNRNDLMAHAEWLANVGRFLTDQPG
mgnify:CR=1 FL=1